MNILLCCGSILVLSLGIGLAAFDVRAGDVPPGVSFDQSAIALPAPFATPGKANPPRILEPPEDWVPRAPEGFRVNRFADTVEDARTLIVAENGDVFLAQSRPGTITLLRDQDGDGVAETRHIYVKGFFRPYGLAIHQNWLYIADTRGVWRVGYPKPHSDRMGPIEAVTQSGVLGSGLGHWTRNLVFAPDGQRFYVAVGSFGNIREEDEPRATIQEFTIEGDHLGTFASGLRNPVGMAFYPGSDDLYTVVNERDGLGDELVPDYLTRVQRGGFYGWPYAYLGSHPQPDFADIRPDLVARSLVPDLMFRSHSAPLGLTFYMADNFPPAYRGDAFVALHGSWNAAQPRGYMVVRVPFNGPDGPEGGYQSFLTGFWAEGEKRAGVYGRPAGLAVAGDGSLLVADDAADVVWRVTWTGQ